MSASHKHAQTREEDDKFLGELVPYEHQEIEFTVEATRAMTPKLPEKITLAEIVTAANKEEKMNDEVFGRYIACKVMEHSQFINNKGPKLPLKELINRLHMYFDLVEFDQLKPTWWSSMRKTFLSFKELEDDAVVEAINTGKGYTGAYSAVYEN